MSDKKKLWAGNIGRTLIGRTIASVRYMNEEEADEMGWDRTPLVIIFGDGTYLFPMSDDEGNDAGAMSHPSIGIIPVI